MRLVKVLILLSFVFSLSLSSADDDHARPEAPAMPRPVTMDPPANSQGIYFSCSTEKLTAVEKEMDALFRK